MMLCPPPLPPKRLQIVQYGVFLMLVARQSAFQYPLSLLSRKRVFSRLVAKRIDQYVHLRITCGHFANNVLLYIIGVNPDQELEVMYSLVTRP